jgi:hypothetical protein
MTQSLILSHPLVWFISLTSPIHSHDSFVVSVYIQGVDSFYKHIPSGGVIHSSDAFHLFCIVHFFVFFPSLHWVHSGCVFYLFTWFILKVCLIPWSGSFEISVASCSLIHSYGRSPHPPWFTQTKWILISYGSLHNNYNSSSVVHSSLASHLKARFTLVLFWKSFFIVHSGFMITRAMWFTSRGCFYPFFWLPLVACCIQLNGSLYTWWKLFPNDSLVYFVSHPIAWFTQGLFPNREGGCLIKSISFVPLGRFGMVFNPTPRLALCCCFYRNLWPTPRWWLHPRPRFILRTYSIQSNDSFFGSFPSVLMTCSSSLFHHLSWLAHRECSYCLLWLASSTCCIIE